MFNAPGAEPLDYLVIGHLTQDVTPKGHRLGGTAAYAALTAKALGYQVGIVTAWNKDLPLPELEGIHITGLPVNRPTTFENIYTEAGRVQRVHHLAEPLEYYLIPQTWRDTPIVHLAPVAHEIPASIVRHFPHSLLGVTPQGWLRQWDDRGRVHYSEWPEADFVLSQADAAVISAEDVPDSQVIQAMAASAPTLVVTRGAGGASVYTLGELHQLTPPELSEVDPTGSGDIFAAAFFLRLNASGDPVDSAGFANQVAALSVTRRGLDGIITPDEIYDLMTKVS